MANNEMKISIESKDALRKAFAVYIAAYDFMSVVNTITSTGKDPKEGKIYKLHIEAKQEIDKEDPDMDKVKEIVQEIEQEVINNKYPAPRYAKGGIIGVDSGDEFIVPPQKPRSGTKEDL